jgi:hypothetical protein
MCSRRRLLVSLVQISNLNLARHETKKKPAPLPFWLGHNQQIIEQE